MSDVHTMRAKKKDLLDLCEKNADKSYVNSQIKAFNCELIKLKVAQEVGFLMILM